MALQQITEPSAALTQLESYNSSQMVVRANYTPPASTAWAAVGLVLADAVQPSDEAALIAAIEALAGVTTVADPRFWGQLPATLFINPGTPNPDTHECHVYATVTLNCTSGTTNNSFAMTDRRVGKIKPPLGKKWIAMNCVLPTPLTNQTSVNNLQTALEGITGITTAKVVIFGQVPAAAVGITLSIEARMRIDPIGTP